MAPEEVAATLGGTASVSGGGPYGRLTVDLPAARWAGAARAARDELGYDFFDWLSAVDELTGFAVVAHVWSVAGRRGLLLRTRIEASVPSIVDSYPGAAWHERETHEMFGIDFPGHPGGLLPLLLAPEFEGYPLRKAFVLATRVAKPWPGAVEPGGSRTPLRPPGVPAPGEWG
jgi:NADH-quinone oxidoreductase subunit C